MSKLQITKPPFRYQPSRWPLLASLALGAIAPAIYGVGPEGDAWPLRDGQYVPVLQVAVVGGFYPPFLLVAVLPQCLLYALPTYFAVRWVVRHRQRGRAA